MRVLLRVTTGPLAGRVFAFEGHDVFLVGRSPNAHCRLPEDDPYFSRVHFLIEVNPPRCRLTDMGSRNGTFVNGRKVEVFELAAGDEIRAGHTVMRVEVYADGGEPETPAGEAGVTKADLVLPPGAIPDIPPSRPRGPVPADEETPSPFADRPLAIPGYQIVRELGRGSMGAVYLARRQADRAEVALKAILPDQIGNPVATARFLREAEVLGQLDHPNIVKFHEAGQAGAALFFAMEYVPGTDVAKILGERPRVELRTAIRLTIQVLNALAHAHAHGLVHRDIKPANVLLAALPDGSRQVKLADFGLARVYRASQLSGLTIHGDLGGTPAYMAPEQITNYREVTPAADQYSTAAMLYQMLTGAFPLDLPPMPAGLLVILQGEAVPLRKRRPEFPAELERVIHRALAKNAGDRFPDVAAFRQALAPFGR